MLIGDKINRDLVINRYSGTQMPGVFIDLLSQIQKGKLSSKTFLVGISGFGGSGKSTLARRLSEFLGNAPVVGMDDFWQHEADIRSADWPAFDRRRLEAQVLQPMQAGKLARYQRYDWSQQSLGEWVTVPKHGYLIVEGISALHPNLMPYYGFSIWVDCPLEVAKERGLARGYSWGIDETTVWLERWMPNDADYFARYRPDLQASFIYPNS